MSKNLFYGFLLSLTAVSLASASSQDPLFFRMEGHWVGQGTRSYPLSGRTTQVAAEVSSAVETVSGEERLTSDNRVTETQVNAAPLSYHTVYWIEAKAGQPGDYILGADQSASSTGTFSLKDGIAAFASDQDLGNGYIIHSETVFHDEGPLFTEITTSGSTVILKSVIQYSRAKP